MRAVKSGLVFLAKALEPFAGGSHAHPGSLSGLLDSQAMLNVPNQKGSTE
jgi:hypothetical protein